MVDLRISQQFGRIGLEIRDAAYDLNVRKPEMELKQTQPQLFVERSDPEVSIDYSPMLESMGYGDIEFISRSFVKKAETAYLQNLEKTVALGQDLAAIQRKLTVGEIIAEYNEPAEKELAIQPLASADIAIRPGTLQMEVILGEIEADVRLGKVSIDNFIFPSVRTYLEQKPELKIEAVGQVFDRRS